LNFTPLGQTVFLGRSEAKKATIGRAKSFVESKVVGDGEYL